MVFFVSICIPLFTLIVFSSRRLTRGAGEGFEANLRALLRGSFLPGLAVGIPVVILLLLLQRLIPLSYKPFRLYLFFTIRDQLVPCLLVLLLAVLLRKAESFPGLFFFLAGFYTVLNWGQMSVGPQHPDLYRLCLLAFVRMAMLIYIPLLFLRFLEEDGFLKLLFLGLMLLFTLTGGLVAYLYMRFYLWPALLAAIALPVSTGVFLFAKTNGYRAQLRRKRQSNG